MPRKFKTKQRMGFRMIHTKDSLPPRGKVWSLDFLSVNTTQEPLQEAPSSESRPKAQGLEVWFFCRNSSHVSHSSNISMSFIINHLTKPTHSPGTASRMMRGNAEVPQD